MKTISLILVGLFLTQHYCFSQEYPDERTIRGYKEIISLYPRELVSHFPEEIEHEKMILTYFMFPRGKYLSYIHIALAADDAKVERLKKDVLMDAKAVYHFCDSCLMFIPYDYEEDIMIDTDSIRTCKETGMLPVSNIKTWADFTPEFYKNATIYVLNAEKGNFLKSDFLSKSGVGLPSEWKHGYSKGIIIFKNYVLYWLEVW